MKPLPTRRWTSIAWTVVGALAALHYFVWLLQPGRAGVVWLYAALVVADLFNAFHAASFWITCLRSPRRRLFRPAASPPRVDVFIPTYNEPIDVLEPTIRGALAMRGALIRVIVLDDGGRLEIAQLARRLGATYLARSEHHGAKAGNINNALKATQADGAPYICVFDSDHVPRPAFLERTLGLFVDEGVALVQTPQVYRNVDAGPLTRGAAEQQAIFFGPICRGRDGFGASFCCGTNFVVRRDALTAAGGFPETSITEDIVLSTHLIGLGYEIAYVDEPLSDGLGPEDAASYLSQQLRWATGCLELLLRRPKLWRPLTWTQRWQFLVATSYWLTGWTVIVYLSLPLLRLAFGLQPIGTDPAGFTTHFLPYFLVAVINLGRHSAGGYSYLGLALNWGCFALHVRATLRVLAGRRTSFAVTSKRALHGLPWLALGPNLLALALATAASAAAAGTIDPATVNNFAFAVIVAGLVGGIVVMSVRQASLVAVDAADLEARDLPAEQVRSAAAGSR